MSVYTYEEVDQDDRDGVVVWKGDEDGEDDSILIPYAIISPDGDEIATVYDETAAQALVSHLNR